MAEVRPAPVTLRLGDRQLPLDRERPLVMGIMNVTPDSVADDAPFGDPEALLARADDLVSQGADLVDVGGESGRTDRPAVSAAEEIERVVPVIEHLAARGVVVSCDTFKPEVARAAIAAGAGLVNDVSGLADPELADACAEGGAGLVLLHTRAAAKTERFPGYDDPVDDVLGFLEGRIALALDAGIAEDSIVIDPGPDFAKTPAESVAVLRSLRRLHALGPPVLLAVSRKYFVGVITGRLPMERAAGTLAALAAGVDAGVDIVRVHDVAATVDFLTVRATMRGRLEVPADDSPDDRLRWLPAEGG